MITYYLDALTEPEHPRLVRRVNNGDWEDFDNNLGTAVAVDAVDLQFTYDISNGTGNPGSVEMDDDRSGRRRQRALPPPVRRRRFGR